jgi:microcystin-dependent protein
MAEPFLSEIRIFSFDFPPKGWAFCNGQTLPINQNQALFALLGTRFGGNGQTNFALPNQQGKVPVHVGPGFQLGQAGGEDAHTVTMNEMPTHQHQVMSNNGTAGEAANPAGKLLGRVNNLYSPNGTPPLTAMHPQTITNAGGSQAHLNQQPYLALNFCIALQGIFPSPN